METLPDTLEEEENSFRRRFPAYGFPDACLDINELRSTHFSRLSDSQVYLDHAGTTLPSEIQLKQSFEYLSSEVLGNPHSGSPSSMNSTKQIELARKEILTWFGVTSQEYSIIFTAGSTASLKLVADSFPFTSSSILRQTISNHTSCTGMRNVAIKHGSTIEIVDHNDENIISSIGKSQTSVEAGTRHLFVYPAESNFSGRKYPLDWIHKYRTLNENSESSWAVLLDASAFISTNELNLAVYPFDFVCFSFHKLFGYPSGLGALLVRKDTVGTCLLKDYFGGGTVESVLATESVQTYRQELSAKYEDGTVAFSSIACLRFGFTLLKKLGSMKNITLHCYSLIRYVYEEARKLQHFNKKSVFSFFGLHHLDDPIKQGAILSFLLYRSDGDIVGYSEVEKLATLSSIHLRTGCFCNAGECHEALTLSPDEIKEHITQGHVCWDDNDIIHGKATGAIRISLGFMSNFSDVSTFLSFIKKYFVEREKRCDVGDRSRGGVGVVERISLFPLKSCGALFVDSWPLTSKGLLFDREWALVDVDSGRALSAKKIPKMVTIFPLLDVENEMITVKAPTMDDLVFPFSPSVDSVVSIRVCGDVCEGVGYGEFINSWFSDYLGVSCQLVRKVSSSVRLCKVKEIERARKNMEGSWEDVKEVIKPELENVPAPQFSFANESQLLFINLASVEHVRERISLPSFATESALDTANRFRANVLVGGLPAFHEDTWKEFRLRDIQFKSLGPCARCKMICTHPSSGIVQNEGEPLASLAEYRRFKGRVMFGSHITYKLQSNDGLSLTIGDKILMQE